MRSPHRRNRKRVIAARVGAIAALTVVIAAGAYVVTENDRSAAALSHAMSENEQARNDLGPLATRLLSVNSEADSPLAASAGHVVDERARSELRTAVDRASALHGQVNDAATAAPATAQGTADGGFHWFWDDSVPVRDTVSRTVKLRALADKAGRAITAVQMGVTHVGRAVDEWKAEQESTLMDGAAVINVASTLASDGTQPTLAAAQALLDTGAHIALTYPGSALTVITVNNYVDPTALTLVPGDLITLTGPFAGTYEVTGTVELTPWTVPPATSLGTSTIAVQTLSWDGKLTRIALLAAHTDMSK